MHGREKREDEQNEPHGAEGEVRLKVEQVDEVHEGVRALPTGDNERQEQGTAFYAIRTTTG